jgi:hypothetical protein
MTGQINKIDIGVASKDSLQVGPVEPAEGKLMQVTDLASEFPLGTRVQVTAVNERFIQGIFTVAAENADGLRYKRGAPHWFEKDHLGMIPS